MTLEKNGIAEGFSQAASTYNRWAEAQKRIARHLAEMIPARPERQNIIDLGCGTGLLTQELLQKFPDAKILGIDIAKGMVDYCSNQWDGEKGLSFERRDIEEYHLSPATDLAATASTIQWLNDSKGVIKKLCDGLSPNGIFAAAAFISGTLEDFFKCADRVFTTPLPRLEYPSSKEWREELESNGFSIISEEEEPITVWYDKPMDVLRTFKGIGATFRHQENYRTRSAAEIRRFLQEYTETHGNDNQAIPMTYRVMYVIARPST